MTTKRLLKKIIEINILFKGKNEKWGSSMSNEAIKRVADLLKAFNDTFKLGARVLEDGEDASVSLTIQGQKNNGAEFINLLHETFDNIVKVSSKDHEVIYHEDKGLIVAKKVVKKVEVIEYEEEF